MPIEIRELTIRVHVNDERQSSNRNPQDDAKKRERIINDSVERVLAIQARKKER